MAIYTTFPHDHPTLSATRCIICNELIPLSQATAGSLYADRKQAYACDRHLASRGTWISAWALFDIEQAAMPRKPLPMPLPVEGHGR